MHYFRYNLQSIKDKLKIKAGMQYRFYKHNVTVVALYDYWILCVDKHGRKYSYTYAELWMNKRNLKDGD